VGWGGGAPHLTSIPTEELGTSPQLPPLDTYPNTSMRCGGGGAESGGHA